MGLEEDEGGGRGVAVRVVDCVVGGIELDGGAVGGGRRPASSGVGVAADMMSGRIDDVDVQYPSYGSRNKQM